MLHRRFIAIAYFLIFIFIGSGPVGSEVLFLTADIQGYLVGCDCPTGHSAGLSALARILEDRGREGAFLVDGGGFREPDRSDPLLESYLDRAAGYLGYDGLILGDEDRRDSFRLLRQRSKNLPLSAAGDIGSRKLFRRYPGENETLLVGNDSLEIAFAAGGGVSLLKDSGADYNIWVLRSGMPFVETGGFVDLAVFTGPDSPAADLQTGGLSGKLADGTPWIALAPRGNGLAQVSFTNAVSPEVKIISLRRGHSPESAVILGYGEAYMEDLTRRAMKASGRETGKADVLAAYWYPYGCRVCEDFRWNFVPILEERFGVNIEIQAKNISNTEDFQELLGILKAKGTALKESPVMVIGEKVLQGDQAIERGLEEAASGKIVTEYGGSGGEVKWAPGVLFLAGLLDGVNPCAFSAMIFLLSALALAGRSKRTMLSIGIFYAAGVFAAYSLIGAGFLGGLKRVVVEYRIRVVFEFILAGILAILAVLSFIDGIRLSRGRGDLLLKLPGKLSGRVHGLIRNSARSGAAAGGALFLGAAVAVIELGCTGQVYLPTIAWMISQGEGISPWLWLALYNMAFILPLLLVFILSYNGVSSRKMAEMFRKRGAVVKYTMAGLLVVFAVFIFVIQ